uniref:Ribosomal protein S16 n=1 Tax=Cryptomeria japonica var. sinensis TaxID=99810 RepID=A0A7D5JAV2_CRYJA|nr:ribosomal protein S16 [Cryptomeria japonica var. sinensis]
MSLKACGRKQRATYRIDVKSRSERRALQELSF